MIPLIRHRLRSRASNGFALVSVVVAVVIVLAVSGLVFRHSVTQKRVIGAQDRLAVGDFSAESLARIMLDRLVARAADNLGVIDSTDIAALNAEIPTLPVPQGVRIDLSATRYTLAAVYNQDVIPYDQEPLRVITDQPRTDYDVVPDVAGVTAARTVEVMMVATVDGTGNANRSAVTRAAISKVLPYQRAIHSAGDMEICVSSGSQLLIDGRVRAEGELLSTCGGTRYIVGEVNAMQGIEVDEASGGSHYLRTGEGDIALASITREDVSRNVGGTIAQYRGRVKVGAGLGERMIGGAFQNAMVAGSGECPDFDGACGGRGNYYPSITISKANPATTSTFNVVCGDAYKRKGDPAGCVAQTTAAVRYVAYPFSGVTPNGTARIDPSTGTYWQGLFPDPRRQDRCVATVDGNDVNTYRCDTAPYGYVIDLAVLGRVEGGLLSIRKTDNGAATYNPSGYQEVVVLENADVLYGGLTVHSELPVYIAGSFNSYSPRPAMIDAPMVTVLPKNWDDQIKERAVWDSTATVSPRPMRAIGRTEVHSILRTRYSLSSGTNYFGGTVEAAPHVLGDWRNAEVLLSGAVEARPWEPAAPEAYHNVHKAYNAIPATVAPRQPKYRLVQFNKEFRSPDYQPPGSWSPENQPTAPGQAVRSEERQRNASGGLSVVRLVQNPTRLPRDSAVAIALPPRDSICPTCSTPDNAPSMTAFSCSPATIMDGDRTTCTASASAGSNSIVEFSFDWADGNVTTSPATGGQGSANHFYYLPGTYKVKARAVDTEMNRSGEMSFDVVVTARPPSISAVCTPLAVKPNQPDGAGEYVDCTVTVTKGTYDIDRYVFNWGDGNSSVVPSNALVYTSSHLYENAGTFTVEMYVVDRSGMESTTRAYATINARHLPPTITSFSCVPDIVEPGQTETCTVTYTEGTTTTQTLTINWGDGTQGSAPVSGGTGVATHTYHTGSETAAEDRYYTITGTISDVAGLQDQATDIVQVRTNLPSASISCTPTALYEGETTNCTVTGTEGTFPIASVTFRPADGSSDVSIPAASAGFPHTYMSPGTYVAQGWATDTRGNESPKSEVTIVVTAVTLPSAPTIVCTPASINAGESTSCTIAPVPGTYPIDRYGIRWDDGSPNYTGSAATQSHVFSTPGTYNVEARTRDDHGNWGPWGSTTVEVGSPPVAPTIGTVSCSPSTVNVGQQSTCTVTAGAGSGTITGYSYDCGVGGPVGNAPSANTSYAFTCTWSSAGLKTVQASVTGTTGSDGPATTQVTVGSPSSARINCPSVVYRGVEFSCWGDVSLGTPFRYQWDWGGGQMTTQNTSANPTQASYTYPLGSPLGQRVVMLTVSTDVGVQTTLQYVDVQDAPPANVSCSVSPNPATEGEYPTITVSYSSTIDVTSVSWYEQGPGGALSTVQNRSPNNTSGSYTDGAMTSDGPGTYYVYVTAETEDGATVNTSCNYQVNGVPDIHYSSVGCFIDLGGSANPRVGDPIGNWWCEATTDVFDALVTVDAVLRDPDGVVVNSCTGGGAATGIGYAKCELPASTAKAGSYTVTASVTATRSGYDSPGPRNIVKGYEVISPSYNCYVLPGSGLVDGSSVIYFDDLYYGGGTDGNEKYYYDGWGGISHIGGGTYSMEVGVSSSTAYVPPSNERYYSTLEISTSSLTSGVTQTKFDGGCSFAGPKFSFGTTAYWNFAYTNSLYDCPEGPSQITMSVSPDGTDGWRWDVVLNSSGDAPNATGPTYGTYAYSFMCGYGLEPGDLPPAYDPGG